MSELVTFRVVIPQEFRSSLWSEKFEAELSSLSLKFDYKDDPKPCAVTDPSGTALIWFDSGAQAWEWLARNEGLIALWLGDSTLNMSIREEDGDQEGQSFFEFGITADLPGNAPSGHKERLIGVAERVAMNVFTQCGGIRGLAYDERIAEKLTRLIPRAESSLTELPQWFGYWNAFYSGAVSKALRSEVGWAGAVIQETGLFTVIRFSQWPWEANLNQLVDISQRVNPEQLVELPTH
jgi:hypothetical protein